MYVDYTLIKKLCWVKETRFKNTVWYLHKTKNANYRCRKLRLGAGMGRRDGSGKGVRKQVMDVFGTVWWYHGVCLCPVHFKWVLYVNYVSKPLKYTLPLRTINFLFYTILCQIWVKHKILIKSVCVRVLISGPANHNK